MELTPISDSTINSVKRLIKIEFLFLALALGLLEFCILQTTNLR
jgi:hypothetical protein